jgi:exonuclease VII small subunit
VASDAVERAMIIAALDARADRLNDVRESTQRAVDALRAAWSSSCDQELADATARMRQMVEDRQAAVARIINGDADTAAPTDTQGQVGASTAGRNAPASSGPGPGQPTPRESELTAADIAAMGWDEYRAFRTTTGIANGGGRGIFG